MTNEQVDKLIKALEDANGVCRSAFQIAERNGSQTNWDAFKDCLNSSLQRQHEILKEFLYEKPTNPLEQEAKALCEAIEKLPESESKILLSRQAANLFQSCSNLKAAFTQMISVASQELDPKTAEDGFYLAEWSTGEKEFVVKNAQYILAIDGSSKCMPKKVWPIRFI